MACRNSKSSCSHSAGQGDSSSGSGGVKAAFLRTPSTSLCVLKVTGEKSKTAMVARSQQGKRMGRGSVQPFELVNHACKVQPEAGQLPSS